MAEDISAVTVNRSYPPDAITIGVAIFVLTLSVELFAPNTWVSRIIADFGAIAFLLSSLIWAASFWSRARVQIGKLKLRYKMVRRSAGIAALLGFCFVATRAAWLTSKNAAPARSRQSQS